METLIKEKFMIRQPVFSVIIPTYNRAARIKIALESLSRQTFADFEVIISDDGSTDNTKEIVDAFRNKLDIKYIWQENWGGPAKPRNTGIQNSIGEWICFLDSDDFWYPNKLEICLNYMDKSDFVYHDFDVVGENVPNYRKQIICRKISTKNSFMDLLLNWNGIANSGVVVRKSIIDQAGHFDENKSLIAVEDFDMWLRVAKITNRFTHISKALGGYLSSPNSLTIQTKKMFEHDNAVLEKYRNELTERQYLNVKALLYIIGGIRCIFNNDRNLANKYFYTGLFSKSRFGEKIIALAFIIMGKNTLKFLKFYRMLQARLVK